MLLRTILAAGMVLGASNWAVQAADLGGPLPDPLNPFYNDAKPALWTGPYLGASVGYGWGESSQQLERRGHGFSEVSPDGANGSINLGYNWQLDKSWVVGAEGEVGLISMTDSAIVYDGHHYDADYSSFFASIRGRAGYLITPAIMLYVTGGAAYMDNNTVSIGNTPGETAVDESRWGYVLGTGTEIKLTEHWNLKGEWLHYDFGSYDGQDSNHEDYTFHDKFDTLRLGVNYLF